MKAVSMAALLIALSHSAVFAACTQQDAMAKAQQVSAKLQTLTAKGHKRSRPRSRKTSSRGRCRTLRKPVKCTTICWPNSQRRSEPARPRDRDGLFHHDFYFASGFKPVAGIESVEHTETIERVVRYGHFAGEPLDGIA